MNINQKNIAVVILILDKVDNQDFQKFKMYKAKMHRPERRNGKNYKPLVFQQMSLKH